MPLHMNKKSPQKTQKTKKIKIPRTDSESGDYTTEIVGAPEAGPKTGLDFQHIQEALDETLQKPKRKK